MSFLRYKIATFTHTDSGGWKAIIRRKGWPIVSKTFRIKRDAQDWARRAEDEIVRGIYIERSDAENFTVSQALDRYLSEVTPTKKPSTQLGDKTQAKQLKSQLGKYSLAVLNADKVAQFRDYRIADGKSNNTVRLELALLSHLYNTAIREWSMGLTVNPVANVRKPAAGEGRNRRLEGDEEERLIAACEKHSNPFLAWIVKLALYTAMRRGEILSLTKNDINLSKRVITLRDTKNHSVRTVPLTDNAFQTIKEALKFKLRPKDTMLLFYGEPGREGLRKGYTINRVWATALERAEI